ncbi:hypothetical protein [Salinibacter ruber]|uniref:Zinc-ribbon domain-containing protein n=1 Tax=Salinibacter ruber TaxID=146919 RepID=A0AAW5P883_9BACT|nr:hypothetical protein [Salinibacter ruber]MCS4157684.1 hypothetical protein [Salinibacter ruber]
MSFESSSKDQAESSAEKEASARSFRWVEKTAEPPQKALAQHAGQGPTTKRKHPAGAKSEKARQMLKKILMMKMLRAKQQRKQQEMQRAQGTSSSEESGGASEGSSSENGSSESGSSESGSADSSSEEDSSEESGDSGEDAAEKEAAKTCPHCGGEITEEGKCPKCGKEVSPEKEANLPDSYLLTDMAKAAAAEGAFRKVAEYEVVQGEGGWYVEKESTGERQNEEPHDTKEEARDHQKALHANVDDMGKEKEASSDCGCGEKTADDSSDSDPCWDGYEQIGMKTKNGKKVPNCVPKDDSKESAKTADDDSDPCWDGYKQVGMKTKDGNKVPNCVPKDDSEKNSSTYGTFARAFAPAGSPVYLPPETETGEKIARAYDQGKISEDEAIYLGALKKAMDKKADALSKTAAPGKVYGTGMMQKAKDALGDPDNRRLLAQGLLGAGLAAGPVASGISKAIDPIRERIRYNRMMELPGRDPKLIDDNMISDEGQRKSYGIEKDAPKEEANERARRQAFSILHEHAPQLTKTPVVARKIIDKNLTAGEPQELLRDAVRKGTDELERQEKRQRVSGNRSRSMMDAAKAIQP